MFLGYTAPHLIAESMLFFLLHMLAQVFPHDDGGRAGDIEGVLGAVLGNLEAAVAGIDYLLTHALYLIAHHQRDLAVGNVPVGQHRTPLYLLHRQYSVPFSMKLMDSVEGLLIILPRYRVLCAEGGLVNLYRWRTTSDTAQHQSAEPEGVCRTKYTTDIVDTSSTMTKGNLGASLKASTERRCISNTLNLCISLLLTLFYLFANLLTCQPFLQGMLKIILFSLRCG